MRFLIALFLIVISIFFSKNFEFFAPFFLIGLIIILFEERKNFGEKFIFSPLFFFTSTYFFVYVSGLLQYSPHPETNFLYSSSYLGFILGWKNSKYYIPFKKIYFPIKSISNRIFLLLIIFSSYIALFYLPSLSYFLLIILHVVSAFHLFREKNKLIKFLNIILTIYFSFLLGKIVVLRYLIILLFIYYYEEKKLNLKKSLLYFFGTIIIFVIFNLRRYLLEGNLSYINISLFGLIEPKIILKLLTAGSDYIRTVNFLISSELLDTYHFGKTYISGILKFFPRDLFLLRPESGNSIINQLLNENYVYNSSTTASTFVGELYVNFGYFSIFGAFVMGYFQKILWNSLVKSKTKYSLLSLSFFYAMQFSLVRDDFNIAFGTFLIYSLSTLILKPNEQYSSSNHSKL